MERRHGGLLLGLIAAVLMLATLPVHAETAPELHVLIDVSGSMKHTDPKNLRRPALKLLGDLLPPKADIGVWFFGNRITPVLTPKPADKRAKAQVRSAADKIRSNEPFTDIPAALEAASSQWMPGTDRNILLLSDGMVDISKDKDINKRARQRLLNTIVPALKKAHVHVHTIALSKGADDKLLSQIAADTGGIFVRAESADALQRAFLKLFEAAAPRDGLPLKENKFVVDKSVKELTILAFRDKADKPTKLKLPNGNTMDAKTANGLKGWHWDPSGGRDLITIDTPPPGEWQIIGAKDPDNRALIVTDLNLSVLQLPTRVYPGERIDGAVAMTNNDKVITKSAFTSEVQAKIADRDEDGKVLQDQKLNDTGASPDILGGDGYFSFDLVRDYAAGVYSVVVTAKSPTFERVWRQNFAMAPNAPVLFKPLTVMPKAAPPPQGEQAQDQSNQTDAHKAQPKPERWLQIVQDPTVITPGTAEIVGKWQCDDQLKPVSVDTRLTQTEQRIPIPGSNAHACRFQGSLRAKLKTGRKMVLTIKPIDIPAISPTAAKPAEQHHAEKNDSSGGIQWLLVGGANVLLLLLVGGGIALWRRKDAKLRENMIEEANS